MTAKEITSRIKDPEAVILLEGYALVEAVKKDTKILSADPTNPHNIDYWRIVRINTDKPYEIGNIVLSFDTFNVTDFECKDRMLRIIPVNQLKLVVKEDNFDKDYKEVFKPNLLIN